MSDLLKTCFLIGLGAAMKGKESTEKILNDWSKNGEIVIDEVKDNLSQLREKGSVKTQTWEDDVKSEIKSGLKELGFVSSEQFDQLQQRLAILEKRLEATSPADQKATDD